MVKLIIAAVIGLAILYFLFQDKIKKLLEGTQADEIVGEYVGNIRDARKMIQLQQACELIEESLDEDSREEFQEIKKEIALKAFSK